MARRLWLEPLESAIARPDPVTTELDIVDAGDSLTSLREAVTQANDSELRTRHDHVRQHAGQQARVAALKAK